jgi:hypothetical protein
MRERACVSSACRENGPHAPGFREKVGNLRICGSGSARSAPSAASAGARPG